MGKAQTFLYPKMCLTYYMYMHSVLDLQIQYIRPTDTVYYYIYSQHRFFNNKKTSLVTQVFVIYSLCQGLIAAITTTKSTSMFATHHSATYEYCISYLAMGIGDSILSRCRRLTWIGWRTLTRHLVDQATSIFPRA